MPHTCRPLRRYWIFPPTADQRPGVHDPSAFCVGRLHSCVVDGALRVVPVRVALRASFVVAVVMGNQCIPNGTHCNGVAIFSRPSGKQAVFARRFPRAVYAGGIATRSTARSSPISAAHPLSVASSAHVVAVVERATWRRRSPTPQPSQRTQHTRTPVVTGRAARGPSPSPCRGSGLIAHSHTRPCGGPLVTRREGAVVAMYRESTPLGWPGPRRSPRLGHGAKPPHVAASISRCADHRAPHRRSSPPASTPQPVRPQ